MPYGFFALVTLILFVLLPRLWRYAMADVLASHRVRVRAGSAYTHTFYERHRRSGPWAWREGAQA